MYFLNSNIAVLPRVLIEEIGGIHGRDREREDWHVEKYRFMFNEN